MIPEDVLLSPMTTYSNVSSGSEFVIDNKRESINRVLAEVNLSPIRSQTRKRLAQHSNSGLRRITSKFNGAMRVLQSEF
jgi:hypothetical protein